MSDKKGNPQQEAEEPIAAAAEGEEAGTEGHFFLSDPNAGRVLAAERERQIQKNLKQHTLEQTGTLALGIWGCLGTDLRALDVGAQRLPGICHSTSHSPVMRTMRSS